LNWRTYSNPIEHFPSLPIVTDESYVNDTGIHLFVHPTSISIVSNDDKSTSKIDQPQLLSNSKFLPDPILRLRTVIGLTCTSNNLLWTYDDNYVLFCSNAIVVQMHIDSQHQWFFIGHTDKISGMILYRHGKLLATIQTGVHGKSDNKRVIEQ
jgi:hypothetical protein